MTEDEKALDVLQRLAGMMPCPKCHEAMIARSRAHSWRCVNPECSVYATFADGYTVIGETIGGVSKLYD